MVDSKVWVRLRTAVAIAEGGCPETWCAKLRAAFKEATAEHVKAQAIGEAWKALAQARYETKADVFDDQWPRCAAAVSRLNDLGVDAYEVEP